MSPEGNLTICSFSPPFYLKIVLEIVGFVSIPLMILVAYLVWKHSSTTKTFRACLTYLQIVSFTVETDMAVNQPWYNFPFLAGYSQSKLAAYLNIPTHALMMFFVFFLCSEIPACLQCFYYRFEETRKLRGKKELWKIGLIYVIISHFYPFVAIYLFNLTKASFERQYEIMLKSYPKCVSLFTETSFEMYDKECDGLIYCIIFFTIILTFSILFGGIFALGTLYILLDFRTLMSKSAFNANILALINLVIISLCPVFFVVFPTVFCLFVIVFEIVEYQVYANLSMVFVTGHSLVYSIVVILTNERYRTILKKWILRKNNQVVNNRMIRFVETIKTFP
ncbi:unnamed protein product [Caenorhabditis angaria]|uniref:Uncharacterized protein n=1 Tax=Caenorhabditis angaria TaxID=860376 RepID=A0A9P1MW29_9PELO|nr:unnamed protein product [Caenorhabditis angaria]